MNETGVVSTEELRRSHHQGAYSARCWECSEDWPCAVTRLLDRIDILERALTHRRDYEAKGWSHVECGAEESVRERLLLARSTLSETS